MGDDLWLPDELKPHESGVRKLVAETHGESYRALSSLDEARQHEWDRKMKEVGKSICVGC